MSDKPKTLRDVVRIVMSEEGLLELRIADLAVALKPHLDAASAEQADEQDDIQVGDEVTRKGHMEVLRVLAWYEGRWWCVADADAPAAPRHCAAEELVLEHRPPLEPGQAVRVGWHVAEVTAREGEGYRVYITGCAPCIRVHRSEIIPLEVPPSLAKEAE